MPLHSFLFFVLIAFTAATASATSAPLSPRTIAATAPQAIATGENQASTDIWTWENYLWFGEVIRDNPDAFIITHGPGITVTNPSGRPLVLPAGPKPRDVTLTTV